MTARKQMPIERKRELVDQAQRDGATINGAYCFITGTHNPFATVGSNSGYRAEYAWETVEHVLATGGKFRT